MARGALGHAENIGSPRMGNDLPQSTRSYPLNPGINSHTTLEIRTQLQMGLLGGPGGGTQYLADQLVQRRWAERSTGTSTGQIQP